MNRGKILSRKIWERRAAFSRYKDVDGDAIAVSHLAGHGSSRMRPGSRVAAATTRRSQYSERPDDYANNMDRLARKFETARTLVPRPELVRNDGNEIGIIAYGTSHHALVETLDQLQNEYGVKADYLRLRAYPFTRETHDFIAAHKRMYIVDQNRDGQMHELLKLDVAVPEIAKLRSVRHYNGLPIDARSITDEIISQEGK